MDGPVTARVKYKVLKEDGRDPSPATPPTQFVVVDVPAWVLVGYPRYAPQIMDIITMNEVVYDVAVRNFCYEPYMYGTTPFSGVQISPNPSDEKALASGERRRNGIPTIIPTSTGISGQFSSDRIAINGNGFRCLHRWRPAQYDRRVRR